MKRGAAFEDFRDIGEESRLLDLQAAILAELARDDQTVAVDHIERGAALVLEHALQYVREVDSHRRIAEPADGAARLRQFGELADIPAHLCIAGPAFGVRFLFIDPDLQRADFGRQHGLQATGADVAQRIAHARVRPIAEQRDGERDREHRRIATAAGAEQSGSQPAQTVLRRHGRGRRIAGWRGFSQRHRRIIAQSLLAPRRAAQPRKSYIIPSILGSHSDMIGM